MKYLMMAVAVLALSAGLLESPTHPKSPFSTDQAEAAIKYVNGYTRSIGTQVSGHYRDTSNDGQSWNNANTLGYND